MAARRVAGNAARSRERTRGDGAYSKVRRMVAGASVGARVVVVLMAVAKVGDTRVKVVNVEAEEACAALEAALVGAGAVDEVAVGLDALVVLAEAVVATTLVTTVVDPAARLLVLAVAALVALVTGGAAVVEAAGSPLVAPAAGVMAAGAPDTLGVGLGVTVARTVAAPIDPDAVPGGEGCSAAPTAEALSGAAVSVPPGAPAAVPGIPAAGGVASCA